MIDKGEAFAPFIIDEWFDCGKAETLLETNRRLLEGAAAPQISGSVLVPPVAIDPSASVVDSVVGPHVSVAADATIERSVVRDSVIDRGATVRGSLLDRSIIGSNALVEGAFQSLNIGDSSEVINNRD